MSKFKANKALDAARKTLEGNPGIFKLCTTVDTKSMEDSEIRVFLDGLYKESDLRLNLLATLLNSIISERKLVFLLSKSILEGLIKCDNNWSKGRSSINGGEYRAFMAHSIGNGYIEKLTNEFKKGKASPVALSEQTLVDHLLETWGMDHSKIEEFKSSLLQFWDKVEVSKSPEVGTFNEDIKRKFRAIVMDQNTAIEGKFSKFLKMLAHDNALPKIEIFEGVISSCFTGDRFASLSEKLKNELFISYEQAQKIYWNKVYSVAREFEYQVKKETDSLDPK